MRVAVIGASGDQGAAQVAALARAGHHPVAISRTPAPLAIDGCPIETARADFADPAAVRAALAGAEALFLNLPSTSFQAAEPLIEATRLIAGIAAEVGISRIVFNTSMPVPDEPHGFEAQDARREMRRLLFAGNVPTVSIQPVVFLDNLLKGWAWPSIRDRGILSYPHRADLDVSWICHADLAALMIAALDRPHLAGRSFPVGGPETVRLPQLAAILSRSCGRTIAWESESIDAFCLRIGRVLESRSTLDSAAIVERLRRIYTWYNESPEHPFRIDMAPVLRELPVKLTPIASWTSTVTWVPSDL